MQLQQQRCAFWFFFGRKKVLVVLLLTGCHDTVIITITALLGTSNIKLFTHTTKFGTCAFTFHGFIYFGLDAFICRPADVAVVPTVL